ncbi:unnamed protein product [Ectocarpus sp. CCAP 1310/34]|nr:unnamed protein product [Ectocarpus sp. CCAP 1310/34]
MPASGLYHMVSLDDLTRAHSASGTGTRVLASVPRGARFHASSSVPVPGRSVIGTRSTRSSRFPSPVCSCRM